MRRLVAVLALGAILAGCVHAPPAPAAPEAPAALAAPGQTDARITCRVLTEADAPLPGGSCAFAWGRERRVLDVDAQGNASLAVPADQTLQLTGRAAGFDELSVSFVTDASRVVALHLPRAAASSNATAAPAAPAHRVAPRAWRAPVRVADFQTEPFLALDPAGTLYYAPTSALYASHDGGATWRDASPQGALPTLGSDASLSIAPDGTAWYARLWAYAGGTVACASHDGGLEWTCDNVAIPGVTDRMAILGLGPASAYLQTNEGAEQAVWARTTDGGATFTPYATEGGAVESTRLGNMALETRGGSAWQVGYAASGVVLVPLGKGPLDEACPTPAPAGLALPSLAASAGALWVAEETERGLVVARSLDACGHWRSWTLPVAAKRAAMAAIGANGDDVAVVYYGSDDAADPATGHGNWSVFVTRTDDALDPAPAWTEEVVARNVHKGPLCIAISCDPTGATDARFAGDFMGVAVGPDGSAMVAFNDDVSSPGTDRAMFARQEPASG